MSLASLAAIALVAAHAGAQAAAPVLTPVSPPDSVARAAAAGSIRFIGRVVERASSTSHMIAGTAYTTVVRVDTLVASPFVIRPPPNKQITVILDDTAGAVVGSRYLFLASGVLFGRDIVLRERGRIPVDMNGLVPQLAEKLRLADSIVARNALAARASGAARIALVRVLGVDTIPGRVRYPGEHDPDWRVARVEVLESIKPARTQLRPAIIRVFFPRSRGWLWSVVPRLAAGDSVVLLLRGLQEVTPSLRTGIDPDGAFVLLDPLDRQDAGKAALVREIVQ